MLKTKTVFVIGAGASIDYGFPSGYDLLQNIRSECVRVLNGDANRLANTGGHAAQDFIDIKTIIETVNFESIDSLLEVHPRLINLGKLLIAISLLPCEKPEAAFQIDKRSSNWMLFLFKRMAGNTLEEFSQNEVTFITFNYDRCLEHFMSRQLMDRYGECESQKNVDAAMKHIPIIHVHGALGTLAAVKYGGFTKHPVGATANQAAACIDIIHQAHPDSVAFTNARSALQAAQKIAFLGFGYHPVNLNRLNFKKLAPAIDVFGTAMGMSVPELKDVYNRMQNPKKCQLIDCDCLELLRKTDLL